MGKPRQHNKHLPRRWCVISGAYYYRVPPGQESQWDGKTKFRLGKNEHEAYKVWAERTDPERGRLFTVSQLLDRYLAEHVPTLAPATKTSYQKQIPALRVFFGDMALDDVEPQHVHQFLRIRSMASPRGASLGKKILQHAYSKARDWGATKAPNPCAGIRTPKAESNRYVEDWEVEAFYRVCNPTLQAFVNLAVMTGMRRKDLLELKLSDLKRPDGIKYVTSKTKRTIIVAWTPELRAAVDQVKAIKRRVGSIYLFSTRDGKCYMDDKAQASGFDSMWQRAMRKALKQTNLTEKFTAHDLRAKAASDLEAGHAQRLLGHRSGATTAGYRRKPDLVMPNNESKLS